LLLALSALNLKPGDEIITSACGFNTTVAPIVQLGLTPVFCDIIGGGRYVIGVEDIRSVVTERTKALMIPNLIGDMPDWPAIRKAFPSLILIEDSADTIGSKTLESDISTTSFYASHVITAGGIGGMVMFNDESLLKRAIMFRDWGRIGDNIEEPSARFNHVVDGIPYDWKFLYGVAGYHLKASEMNAAFGLVQFAKLTRLLAIRRANFERYMERLKEVVWYYKLPDDSRKSNWLAFPLMCQPGDRLELLTFLEERDIQTRVIFSGNITRHPAFRDKYLNDFKNSDIVMRDGFLLGAHHGMDISDTNYVCDQLIKFAESKATSSKRPHLPHGNIS
jgi:CDP-6-deoxy-D-xylo-4-hexulose-3-dehydrase